MNYLDSFVAGVDFDPHGAVFKIDFVPSARFAADDGMGHLRACGMLKRMFPPIKSHFSVVYDCGSMG